MAKWSLTGVSKSIGHSFHPDSEDSIGGGAPASLWRLCIGHSWKVRNDSGDAAIEMGSLNSMCDKSGRGQVEHLTVKEILQNSLSLLPSTLSLSCAWVESWGWEKDTDACVCMCKDSQSSELSLAETVTPSVSCLKSVLTLCHNLDSWELLIISPFPYLQTSFHRWLIHCLDDVLQTVRGKQLPNEQEVVYPNTGCFDKTHECQKEGK